MAKPLVYVDVDNVLTPFDMTVIEGLIRKCPGFHGYEPPYGKWEMFEDPKIASLKRWIWHQVLDTPWFAGLQPYPEALKAVRQLKRLATVRIVTKTLPGPYWVSNRLQWLNTHFDFDTGDVTFTAHKEVIDCDVFVDDNPNFIRSWAKRHPDGVGVLWKFERYLRPGKQPDNVIHTGDWKEVFRIVKLVRKVR